MSDRTDKRTTVSLAHVVWEMAEEQMQAKGFNDNFSAYCADLIRRDREKSSANNAQNVNAFFDAAAQGRIASNSSASPAFQAILADAARAAAGHDAPPAHSAAIQPATYAPRRQAKPRRPSKLKK